MLHLLPIRLILVVFALYCGGLAAWTIRFEALNGSTAHDLWFLISRLIGAPTALLLAIYALWRISKPFQMFIFPKVGGEWDGHISYVVGKETRKKVAKLFIKQNFTSIVLVLESEESTSQTLVVSPQKDETGTQFKLYYVFENQRKPKYCVPGRPTNYRGVAIIGFDRELRNLSGQYFTEQSTRGNVEFRLIKPSWL